MISLAGLLLAASALLELFPVAVQAQLTFEETLLEREPAGGVRHVSASYAFKNTGAYALTIRSLKTAHPRLTAALEREKRTIRPGEEGIVTLSWRNSGIPEPVDAAVTLTTDEVRNREYVLTLRLLPQGFMAARAAKEAEKARLAAIPAPLELKPRALSWKVGEAAEARTFVVTAAGDQPVTVKGLTDAFGRERGLKGWETSVEPIEAGRSYRVTVKPKSTAKPQFTRLLLQTDLEGDVAKAWGRRLGVMAVVQPPRPGVEGAADKAGGAPAEAAGAQAKPSAQESAGKGGEAAEQRE